MSNIIDSSVSTSLKQQFSWDHAKKAYSAGITGAVGATATISLPNILADGKVDGPEVVGAIGVVVAGFVAGFLAAWLPSQKPTRKGPGEGDALTSNDGLGTSPDISHAAK